MPPISKWILSMERRGWVYVYNLGTHLFLLSNFIEILDQLKNGGELEELKKLTTLKLRLKIGKVVILKIVKKLSG